MNDEHGQRDIDVATLALLGAGLVGGVATSFGYVIPELFNMHSSAADLGALAVAGGTITTAYLAGRWLWRSYRTLTDGDDE